MNRIYKITVLLLIVLISLKISAQSDSAKIHLNEVIISATKKSGTNLNLPYSVASYSPLQIKEQMPRSLPEALTGLSGIFVQKTNHGGGSPFIRGLTGNQALTLIEGVRLNNATFRYGPNQYLNTIDLLSVDKIEIVKGSGSVQYGSDAMGGVIQVFTKEPQFSNQPRLNGRVLGKYMSQNMEKTLRGELQFVSKHFALLAGYSYKKFGDLWGGDTTGRQNPSGYNENAFDIKLKYAFSHGWLLKAAHQAVIQTDVPLYHKVKLENYAVSKFDPQKRMLTYATLEKYFSNEYIKKLQITLSNQQTKEVRVNRKNNSPKSSEENDRINTTGITADLAHYFNRFWTANSGVEFYLDKVNSSKRDINTTDHSSQYLRGLYPDNSHYASLSAYSLHHLKWNKWAAEAGLRYNTFSISIYDTTLGRVTTHPSAWVANIGLVRMFNSQHSIYFNYSSGFRAPNIDDMGTLGIVDFRYEQPAYNLKPERSANVELGYKLSAKKAYANIALFYNHLNNLITRQKIEGQVINGYPVYQKVNSEKAYIYGTDVEVGFNIIKNLDALAITSYTFGQNITKEEPLRRIPPNNKRILVTYHKEKWYAKAEFLTAKKQGRLAKADTEDNRIPAGGTPGWNVLNFYGGYYFKNVLLNMGLQNVFNEDYRMHGSGINGMGRSVWVAINVNL